MIDLVNNRRWFFLISAILIVTGLIFLAFFGLNLGIDFSSGTAVTLNIEPPSRIADLRQEMTRLGYEEAVIQDAGGGDFFVRTRAIDSEERQAMFSGLEAGLGASVTELALYSVSPVIAQGTVRNTGIAILVTAIGILLYLAWAFRRMPKPVRWGTCAVAALVHDVLVVVILFAVLGKVAGYEIDAAFVTGLLAVVGISVNNTVVVFDRIRANLKRGVGSFELGVNAGINESIVRSLNTGLATLFVILAIYLLGGVTVRNLVLVLLVGIATGIYSSLCIAGQLLVTWQKLSPRGLLSKRQPTGQV
ncbi:MAG: protein translocase subunit SecF [Dehalococcoidia bacterium]|nr:MAG: protein translocase subunit SecF [Dehalococcoidia bacterium]